MQTATQEAAPHRVLDFDEAADYLGVSRRSLERAVRDKRVSHIRIGRLVRFTKDDLDDFLDDRRVPVEGTGHATGGPGHVIR